MFEPTWVEAFKYVRAVTDCDLKHYSWLLNGARNAIGDGRDKDWDELQLDLANQYMRFECYEAAEDTFGGLIGYTKFPDIEAKAKAGLDRALAARARG